MMKRIFVLLIFYFSLSICFLSAQTYNDESDNKRYFYDVGFSYSTLIFRGDASMLNIHGAYYFSQNLGVRTGLSYTRDITDDCDWLIKIPALFSFRSETIDSVEEPDFSEAETFGEMLFSTLLCIVPKRFEVNGGPSLGYMHPYRKLTDEEKLYDDNYFIDTRPMLTLDLNGKMTIPINKVGMDLSLGISYFVTNNVKSYAENGLDKKTQRWMGNFTVGVHYRF